MTLNINISDTTQPLNAELFVQLLELAGMTPNAGKTDGEPTRRAYTPRGTGETQAQRYQRRRRELAERFGRDIVRKATNAEMQARNLCPAETEWADPIARYEALVLVGYDLAGDSDSDIVRVGTGSEASDEVEDEQDEQDETPLQARLREIAEQEGDE